MTHIFVFGIWFGFFVLFFFFDGEDGITTTDMHFSQTHPGGRGSGSHEHQLPCPTLPPGRSAVPTSSQGMLREQRVLPCLMILFILENPLHSFSLFHSRSPEMSVSKCFAFLIFPLFSQRGSVEILLGMDSTQP